MEFMDRGRCSLLVQGQLFALKTRDSCNAADFYPSLSLRIRVHRQIYSEHIRVHVHRSPICPHDTLLGGLLALEVSKLTALLSLVTLFMLTI